MESEDATPSLAQAQRMKKLSQAGQLDMDAIFAINYRLSRFRLRRNSRSRSRIMVSSICWGVVPLGKYFRSLSMPILTVSF